MSNTLALGRGEGREQPAHGVSIGDASRVWLRVAALSFGGPAGQIAVMHRILVDEKRWVSESRFMHALNYCMLLPGPEAQQLATYIGWLMHRSLGGLMAVFFFQSARAFGSQDRSCGCKWAFWSAWPACRACGTGASASAVGLRTVRIDDQSARRENQTLASG